MNAADLDNEEIRLMRLLVTDATAMEISKIMNMPYFTCQAKINRLATFYRVRGRVGLVRCAFANGIVTLKEIADKRLQALYGDIVPPR